MRDIKMYNPDRYLQDNYLVLDFETDTSHGDYGHAVHRDNKLLLACWSLGRGHPAYEGARTYGVFGDEYSQEMLLRHLEVADILVAHNAKYELGWLRRCGYSLGDSLVFDTKLAEYVLFGNLAAGCNATGLPPRRTSLDACTRRRGGKQKDIFVDAMMRKGINPVRIPRRWLEGRCRQDVETTEQLFLDQRQALADTGRLGVLLTRCLLTPVLTEMEFQGVRLDKDRVYAAYTKTLARYRELDAELERITGGINWRSGVQVAEYLYDTLKFAEPKNRDGTPQRTTAGRRKTDKSTMGSLKAKTKEQKEFVKIRSELTQLSAALTKSLEFFKGIVDEKDEIFYAVFNQTVTATHRLSSSGISTVFEQFENAKSVQLQNMARAFKPMFIPKESGWLMMEVDGSQIEFRVAAQLGKDAVAIADITNPDFDAHIQSASVMNDVPYEEMLELYRSGDKKTKEQRTAAKVDTFKPLYGGQSGTKKQKRWYKAFGERYSGIAQAQNRWIADVLSAKKLVTPWGLQFFWPRASVGRDGYVNVRTSVCNYPVQSLATAEIIPIAMVFLADRLTGCEGVHMVNTVHDSVILEVRPDMIDFVKEQAIHAFTTDVYEYCERVYKLKFVVPLGCGVTVGSHWSEGDEVSFNVWPDGKIEQAA